VQTSIDSGRKRAWTSRARSYLKPSETFYSRWPRPGWNWPNKEEMASASGAEPPVMQQQQQDQPKNDDKKE
jgi:hypothetical protein